MDLLVPLYSADTDSHMGHEKKRSSLYDIPLVPAQSPGHTSSFSTASSLSRQPLAGRNYTHVPRSPSPPASTYFSSFAGNAEPQPTPDANAHFAYSTTLRRHHPDQSLSGGSSAFQSLGSVVSTEGAELWDRVMSKVAGGPSAEETMEQGHANGHSVKGQQETPSSQYAHFTVEVGALWHLLDDITN